MALVRSAVPSDYPAFSRLFLELGVDDPIPDEARFLAEMMAATLVAEEDGQILGYAFFQVLRATTYVRNLVTAPKARRKGVARALMGVVAERARQAGCATWSLNVKPENLAGVRLYESLGMRLDHHATALWIPWSAVDGVPALPTRTVGPEDDEALERLAEQEPGILAAQRARGRIVLGSVDEAGAFCALAVVAPHFPGAFPLFVVRAEDVLPLVAAVRPLATASSERLALAVERRPDLVRRLIDAGAHVRMEIDQMKGPLP